MGVNEPDVHDEELLNVLRRANEPLSNSEIAEHVIIGSTQVNNRMKDLLESDRVEKRKVGTGHLWVLHPAESDVIIHPDYEWVATWSNRLRNVSSACKPVGMYGTLVGALLLMIALTAIVGSPEVPLISNTKALAYGYLIVGMGASFWFIATALNIVGSALPRIMLHFHPIELPGD